MVCGSNCAENHPISMKWIDEAMSRKKNPAKLIVVDPRFTRTAARADIYAQIRPGTDIAFFGGLINYAIENDKIQKDYVLNYTNASFLVNPAYSFDEKTGLFSGYNKEKRKYDPSSWSYELGPDGKPLKDPTLSNPRCVYQIVKKHYSRYTPEMVEKITGMPKDKFFAIAETYCATCEPGKSGVLMYAMGLTQHTYGTQNIRAFCILQLLLGNMGMPGGGINAMRGESNVQSSTDFALLWHLLPGYLAVPNSTKHQTLADYISKFIESKGKDSFWKNSDKFMVSLLKSFFGAAATPENQFGYGWLPKVQDGKNYSHIALFESMYKKDPKKPILGLMLWGQNPCVGGPNANMEAKALENLDWMVAVDLWETETAAFWKRPGADPSKIDTEVFLLPAAASFEKEGSITNSGRVIQWRYKACEPPGEAKPDLAIVNMLAKKLIELYRADEKAPNREAIINLYWPYKGEEPNPDDVMKEINGFTWPEQKQVKNFTALKADGSTSCGCWIFSGVYPSESDYPGMDKPETKEAALVDFKKTGGNLAKRTNNEDKSNIGIYPKWAFCWPVNRRIIYNRCSADPAGQPWNKEKELVRWDGTKWVTNDVPDFKYIDTDKPDKPPVPPNVSASNAFIMQPFGVGHTFAPTGLNDGPLPEFYEPVESPLRNIMNETQYNPAIKIWDADMDKLAEVGDKKFPIVCTTWRVTEHWQAGQMTRNLPWLAEMQPELFVEMSKDLAKRKGIKNGDRVKVKSIRGEVEGVAIVTDRVQVFNLNGNKVDVVGLPWHYGYMGYVIGGPKGKSYAANQLTPHVGDANTTIPEYKAFLVDIEKA